MYVVDASKAVTQVDTYLMSDGGCITVTKRETLTESFARGFCSMNPGSFAEEGTLCGKAGTWVKAVNFDAFIFQDGDNVISVCHPTLAGVREMFETNLIHAN